MAAPAEYNLDIYIGDTFTLQVTNEDASGAPHDIEDRVYSMHVRRTRDGVVQAEATCTTTSTGGGIFTCVISSGETAQLTPGSYVYDVQELVDDSVITLLHGQVLITGDVTR
jgi:hypothetical protein